MNRHFILFGLVGALALTLGFFTFTGTRAVWMVKEFGYWFVLTTGILFVGHFWRTVRDEWTAGWWRRHRGAVGAILVLSTLLHVPEPHEFKIVMDEVVLQATASGLHFEREAKAVVRAYDLAGNFVALNFYVDKRPLAFPFLLATAHDLTGFRIANVFWLNGLATLGMLLAVYGVGCRLQGRAAGWCAVLLMATLPLLIQNAVSGGFEVLNLMMIALTVWLGQCFLARPADDDRLVVFALSGVLLAQVRYESVLFLLPVGVTILLGWWRQREVRLPPTFFAVPPLLVIYPWQYNVFRLAESTWQLSDIEGATSVFGLHYLYDNVGHALNFFFTFDGSQPNSWLLALAGLPAVGFFLLRIFKEHRVWWRENPAATAFAVFGAGLLLHAVFILCYFWGKWDHPLIRRLSLPTHLLLAWSIVFVLPAFVKHPRLWRVAGGVVALYFLGVTLPTAARHAYSQENFAARTNTWLGEWIRAQGDQRLFAIDGNSSLQWLINRQSAVMPEAVAKKPERLLFHFRNRTFDDYLVVQRVEVNFAAGITSPFVKDDLGPGFTLEMVAEKRFSPNYIIRLSRIVAMDEAAIYAWAEQRLTAAGVPGDVRVAMEKAEADQIDLWLEQLP